MSEFLFIAPSDYIAVNIDDFCNAIGWGIAQLKDVEESQYYTNLNEAINNFGLMPEGVENITGIKLIEDAELYVKYE